MPMDRKAIMDRKPPPRDGSFQANPRNGGNRSAAPPLDSDLSDRATPKRKCLPGQLAHNPLVALPVPATEATQTGRERAKERVSEPSAHFVPLDPTFALTGRTRAAQGVPFCEVIKRGIERIGNGTNIGDGVSPGSSDFRSAWLLHAGKYRRDRE